MQATINVTGTVQGVGFRPFIYSLAYENNLTGYVQNLGDAGVRILAEGTRHHIETFLEEIRNKRPPLAHIENIHIQWKTEKHTHNDFTIKQSLTEKMGETSIVPPDVSICDECLHDLNEKNNRRHNYFLLCVIN